ncbi:GTPase domain-containing protein [Aquipuribacter sp. SD81]|uniref:GTPase domain-containing protein n=1 Tax=Aquipuribacter sp. SD81 TaxID=3127703 RepID=UPI003019FA5A
MTTVDGASLVAALGALRAELGAVDLPYEVSGVQADRDLVAAVCRQVDDYLLPRLERLEAPLLVVVGGSTGAGKSTLVNSLLRNQVSRSGVLRPTTRAPVLVHHPSDAHWFADLRVLPGLARVHGPEEDLPADRPITTVRVVADEALQPGLALLDAPDVDSVVDSNRALAAQLLAAADLWLFVTTAARYADAVPWGLLQEAAARAAALAVVLNRVPPAAMTEVRDDLAGMLASNGLGASPMFTVPDSDVDGGLLPRRVVAPLASWLTGLASDEAARGVVIRRTVTGALNTLGERVTRVAAAADEQNAAATELRTLARDRYVSGRERLDTALSDGSVLRGEVLARWQEALGTGELWRGFESRVSRARDRVVGLVRGRRAPVEKLGEALQSSTHALVVSELTAAAGDTAREWRARPAGAALLRERPQLGRPADGTDEAVERLVRDWQAAVIALVSEQGEGKKAQARAVSLGVNGVGFVLMLVVFGHTAGLTGGEFAIAGGTAVVSQRLLEAILGDEAVRSLAARARADLLDRVGALLETERRRWVEAAPVADAGARLRVALEQLEEAR